MLYQDVDISKFLINGKITIWPSKTKPKEAVRFYLASKIEAGKSYSEKEINELLNEYHTFGDPALIRRELCDHGLLKRVPSGARYWRD